MSKEGRGFIVANGADIPNEGEFKVPSVSNDGVWSNHLWQVAPVTRPLLSIGEESEGGKLFVFGARGGCIYNLMTQEIETFPRIDGTYEMTMHVPPSALVESASAASGFTRQGQQE